MNLSDLLELDAPYPTDKFERLLRLRAQWAALCDRTYRTMCSLYPDYEKTTDLLMARMMEAEGETGALPGGGDA